MSVASEARSRFRAQLSFGDPVSHRNLLAIPLLLGEESAEHPVRYVPFHQALAAGTVTIHETGTVSSLHLTCRSQDPVFAPAGSYLRGGGQDRMLVVSVVVAGDTDVDIPVRCVEARRWNPAGQAYEIPQSGSFVATNLSSGSRSTEQSQTWTTIDEVTQETVVDAPTRRHGDVYEHRAETLDVYRNALGPDRFPGRVVGMLFVAQSPQGPRAHWALDVFGRTDLFQAFFPGLRDAATVTALALAGPDGGDGVWENVPGGAEREILDLLRTEEVTEEPTVAARGRLHTAVPDSASAVSVFEDEGEVLHALVRRTRS